MYITKQKNSVQTVCFTNVTNVCHGKMEINQVLQWPQALKQGNTPKTLFSGNYEKENTVGM